MGMSKDYKSLLEYKKSSGDWHYDPSIPSSDSQYIGRIVDLDFSKIKSKLEEKESEHAVELYEDDFKDGTLIPSQLSPNSVGASKLDHIENGYNKHNSRYTQWIDNRDDYLLVFSEQTFPLKYSPFILYLPSIFQYPFLLCPFL